MTPETNDQTTRMPGDSFFKWLTVVVFVFETTTVFRGDGRWLNPLRVPFGDAIIGVQKESVLKADKFSQPMPVPPVLAPTSKANGVTNYELNVQSGSMSFFPNVSTDTFGYNGRFFGPTIRLARGEQVSIRVNNRLAAGRAENVTNVHWHGMRIPAAADGPHNDIDPQTSFTSRFSVIQPAATLWYHPHSTQSGWQVFLGLAGFLYLDDAVSDALPLPRRYGVDDFPIAVQDKNFNSTGSLFYDMPGPFHARESRVLGEYILVNGVINPYLDVPRGTVRLRLLNASDSRRYNFALEDGRTFHVIASDGGFLDAPVAVTSIALAPAERTEILVDFGRDDVGSRVKLVSTQFPVGHDEVGPYVLGMPIVIRGKSVAVVSPMSMGMPFPVMELRIAGMGTTIPVPKTLVPVDRIPERDSTTTRLFELERTGENTINDKKFDMGRIDAEVREGATEEWVVTNFDVRFSHSFHIHGVQFQILDRSLNGEPETVSPIERGWKDTVVVHPGERIRVISRFDHLSGRYMFHCHVLMHENRGMMGTFVVSDGSPTATLDHSTHR